MAPFQAVIETRSYRQATEDRAVVVPHDDGLVLIVADGVGGRPGGGHAAERAVQLLAAASPIVRNLFDPEAWRGLLFDVDAALHADPQAGETTAVILGVSERGIAGASVGDSEAWLIPDRVNEPVVRLTAQQRRKPYLGYASAVAQGFRSPDFSGTLLLATDGLFKIVDEAHIRPAATGSDLWTAAGAVAELARNSDGSFYDDLALILCRRGELRRTG